MSENFITRATYKEGHSRLGHGNIGISLVAGTHDFILRQQSDGRNLVAFPKANLTTARYKILIKGGLSWEIGFIASLIPLLNLTNKADSFYNGVQIGYWDAEIYREELLFLDTRTERNARRVTRKMWEIQADHMRGRVRLGQLMR